MFSPRELSFFEKLFNMESGYVLDFSRDRLKNFIRESVNLDVFTLDYSNQVKNRFRTDSMANTLKYFWETEDFNKTLKLVSDLVDYYYESECYGDENEVAEAKIILNRYYNPVKIKNDYSDEKRISDLINEINHIIDEREPIFAVEKLHTLTQFIFRQICDSHNIPYTKTDRVDSLFKKYAQFLNQNNFIESKMSKTIFRNTGNGRDMQFLGLAAPGNRNLSSDRDLVAFWRSMGDKRFQNYEAYFTILDTGKNEIPRIWLEKLINDHENSLAYAPPVWRNFIEKGRSGITPLKAPKIFKIPNKYEQLQCDIEGEQCLDQIRHYYKAFPQDFEACATDLIMKMDTNFVEFNLTRPWRDGGRDAIGRYMIRQPGYANHPLTIDCALEAKCYSKTSSVGVKQMSRLISRIRYRQFGIMITTSYVDKQAYKEVVEDGHPILVVSATDIASILRKNSIHSGDVKEWLNSIGTRKNIEYTLDNIDIPMAAEETISYGI